MRAFTTGMPAMSATAVRSDSPMLAACPGENSWLEDSPAKFSGTMACTGGSAEGVAEGAPADSVDVAEGLPLGLRVAAREVLPLRD